MCNFVLYVRVLIQSSIKSDAYLGVGPRLPIQDLARPILAGPFNIVFMSKWHNSLVVFGLKDPYSDILYFDSIL